MPWWQSNWRGLPWQAMLWCWQLASPCQLVCHPLPELSATTGPESLPWQCLALAWWHPSCQFYYWLLNRAGTVARGCLVATCQGQRPGRASLSLALSLYNPGSRLWQCPGWLAWLRGKLVASNIPDAGNVLPPLLTRRLSSPGCRAASHRHEIVRVPGASRLWGRGRNVCIG